MAKRSAGIESSANALHFAADVLRMQLAEVLSLRGTALETEDVEGVHKMRVAIRRLRSSLRDFAPYLNDRLLEQSHRDLKRMARALGAARDEDVALAALEKLREKAKKEYVRKRLAKMLKKRRAAREKVQHDLIETLAAPPFDKMRARFLAALDETLAADEKAAALTAGQIGREIIAGSLREFISLSESLYEPFEIERLHKLRIGAKRLRYTLEIFDAAWRERLAPFTGEIARLQTQLGELHDADFWIEKLSRRLHKNKARRAELWLLSRFAQRRTKHYRAALRLWNKWQKKRLLAKLGAAIDAESEVQ